MPLVSGGFRRTIELPVPTAEAVIAVVATGVPVCLVRLWLIWWRSDCYSCGLERNACVCPSGEHTMRPRR
jgi:hypothetical protein